MLVSLWLPAVFFCVALCRCPAVNRFLCAFVSARQRVGCGRGLCRSTVSRKHDGFLSCAVEDWAVNALISRIEE